MRLWTLHPKYLDAKGLVALWREALLAQKVLRGATKGYRHHPQLLRFSNSKNPPAALAAYLKAVHEEPCAAITISTLQKSAPAVRAEKSGRPAANCFTNGRI